MVNILYTIFLFINCSRALCKLFVDIVICTGIILFIMFISLFIHINFRRIIESIYLMYINIYERYTTFTNIDQNTTDWNTTLKDWEKKKSTTTSRTFTLPILKKICTNCGFLPFSYEDFELVAVKQASYSNHLRLLSIKLKCEVGNFHRLAPYVDIDFRIGFGVMDLLFVGLYFSIWA